MLTRLFRDNSGLGMAELAVAIVLLGIVIVGLAPLLVHSIGLAQSNSEVGQANRIVSTQLDIARAEISGSACSAVMNEALALEAGDASRFNANRTVSCNSESTLATVTIDVTRGSEPSRVLSSATTQILTTS